MRVLSVFFISFLINLKVFAFEKDELYTIPDKLLSDTLPVDTAINNEEVGDTLYPTDNNGYFLLTSLNPTEEQRLVNKDEESVKKSNLDFCKNTLVVIHGWTGDHQNELNQNISNAVLYSKHGSYWNVIRVDWSHEANNEYTLASAAVRKVGEYLCNFLEFLTTLGLSFLKTVLIGQSLGAHVAGLAGRNCKRKIAIIIGTDPARPFWEEHPEKLSKCDACYVTVVHSSIVFGDPSLIGDSDFYPNGADETESCGDDILCKHNMAARYWCDSWSNPDEYIANQCSCLDDMEQNTCTGPEVPFGGCNMSNQPEGIYRFNAKL